MYTPSAVLKSHLLASSLDCLALWIALSFWFLFHQLKRDEKIKLAIQGIENQNEVFSPQKLVESININLNYRQEITKPFKILPDNQTP